MLTNIRKSRLSKVFSGFMTLTFITTNLAPLHVFALTSGPSQPETQQFAPAGMDNMVDPFTGDFSYNIPLMDVGGYPINLNYAAGITPDAEASWVGLGWNLNVGAINRSVRGLPDDFAGEEVETQYNVKPNESFGLNMSANVTKLEGWGLKIGVSQSLNVFYNNYNGFGFSVGMSPSIDVALSKKSKYKVGLGANFSLGSEDGVGITPSVGIGPRQDAGAKETGFGATLSFPYSTREGLKGMSLSSSYSYRHKGGRARSAGSDAFMGFAFPTYTPTVSHDLVNVNATVGLSAELSNEAVETGLFSISGYYAGQYLKRGTKKNPAYGYMYAGLDGQSDEAMHDFNREKDNGAFNDATKNLALTSHTYDIFSVSGQGVGGSYRLFRGDVGSVGDPINVEENHIGELGVGLGFGSTPSVKVNVDVKYNRVGTVSSRWSNDKLQRFNDPTQDYNTARERVYFKKIGELAPETDGNFLNNVQKSFNPISYNIASNDGILDGGMFDNKKPDIGSVTFGERSARRKRNNQFTYITAGESYQKYSLMPIKNHILNTFSTITTTPNTSTPASRKDNTISYPTLPDIERVTEERKSSHITEVRVTDNSGARYHYGIPVYNNYQEELTFAVNTGDRTSAKRDNLVGYSDTEASSGNKSGLDHHFSKVITPPYATSYLLTCILSADYVDSDGIPGPSDGDLGNYTKFNYARTSTNFEWRTPYQEGKASFTDGLESKDNDDKANYLYGKKEIWYLHSIETRTHVAEFYMSPRQDGKGVKNSRGGISTSTENTLYKLDKIELYAKADKLNLNPEPLKTVHLKYSYKLCTNTPNSTYDATVNPDKGKLTLDKVWFTYGRAGKGVLNPYVFKYADRDHTNDSDNLTLDVNQMDNNPEYNLKDYDRWGNYKKQPASGLRNDAFPYVTQDKSIADKECAVYSLASIRTPTGGIIKVHYESDDYAYVQDRRAMRMFKIKGLSHGADGSPSSTVYDILDGGLAGKMFLHVDLGEGFDARNLAHANEILRKEYLSGIDLMYYKAKLNVINNPGVGLSGDVTEYVPGYTEIDLNASQIKDYANIPNSGTSELKIHISSAVVKLQPDRTKVSGQTQDINPIAKNGWMFAKLNLSRELKGLGDADDAGVLQIVKSLLAQIDGIMTFLTGFGTIMSAKGNSNGIVTEESFVRLNDPDLVKIGGGHRVKAIIMSDNWHQMSSKLGTSVKEVAFYGQKYDYVKEDLSPVLDKDGKATNRVVSSGVASYEPMVGNDENPFRMPVYSIQKLPLAPSKEFYLEEPFGEMFFPSPTVGYSRVVTTPVKVINQIYNVNALASNGTGFVEQEFYTAKDFPTLTERTGLEHKRDKPNLILNFLKLGSTDVVTCTQGFKVELNDMHGKEKSKKVMPDASTAKPNEQVQPISYVEYKYKLGINGSSLSNTVKYIDPKQNLKIVPESDETQLGVDVDVVHDSKFYKAVTAGGGLDFNTKGIFPVIPIIGVVPMPTWALESTEFKSVVTTKIINRVGILEKTIAMDNGQTITTENLAWDKETGEVLLTKVENEFHDPIWNFTYPGYWAYDEMALAYQNEGILFKNVAGYTVDDFKTFLKDGDELMCESSSGNKLGYCSVTGTGALMTKKILSREGPEITGITRAKVIRSGSRNVAMTPVASVSCLDDPMRDGNNLQFTKVLNAGATEFKSVWKGFCNCLDDQKVAAANPFVLGKKGSLRPWKSWTYLTERTQTQSNNNLNLRNDGVFTDYTSFWSPSTGLLKAVSTELPASGHKWQYVTEIQNYNPIGMEIENKDALGRYSMAQFGYGRNLPTATSNNSKYSETGFDGFEDYDYGDCNDDHFSWRSLNPTIINTESHTGRSAIQVAPKSTQTITKIINPCE